MTAWLFLLVIGIRPTTKADCDLQINHFASSRGGQVETLLSGQIKVLLNMSYLRDGFRYGADTARHDYNREEAGLIPFEFKIILPIS